MSHYRKKAYKKKHLDVIHQKEMIDAMKNEVESYLENIFNGQEVIEMEDPLENYNDFSNDYNFDIVTILKEEEKQGLLPMWLLNKNEKSLEKTKSKEINNLDKTPIKPKSYDEALKIANKVMKQINR